VALATTGQPRPGIRRWLLRTLVTPHLRARDRSRSPRTTATMPRDLKGTAGADGSLDVIQGRGGESAHPIRPRGRIRPPARLSLPCLSGTRGWG
jgi:hypothetical protein